MSDGKKQPNPLRDPVGFLLRSSIMFLFAVIALNIAITYLEQIMGWLVGGAALVAALWIGSALVRWHKSRW
jgi:hypothetical protein